MNSAAARCTTARRERIVPWRATPRVHTRAALRAADANSRARRRVTTPRAMGPDDAPGETHEQAFPPGLRTWHLALRDVPLARILPRDADFGPGVSDQERDGETAERLAFFGDKLLNSAVASAVYERHGLALSTGEMSTLVARARSNQLFAKLLPKLLREDMVAATPADAARRGRAHSAGTMVEAAVFLVFENGGDAASAAIAEVGAFLLAEAAAGPTASDVTNHKGTLVELVAKGVPGSLRSKGLGPQAPDQEFEAVAKLDGASASARARTKREAEQRAARGVFEALVSGQGRAHGGRWAGTPDAPVAPPQAFERDE